MSISLAGPGASHVPRPVRAMRAVDDLELATTPQHLLRALPRRVRGPLLASLCLTLVAVVLLSVGGVPVGYNAAFLPAFLTLVAAGDVLTTVLLVEHYSADGGPRLLVLSWAYGWSALTIVPYALTFPGVVSAGGIAPSAPSSAAWLWATWHVGFALLAGAALMPWPASWRARLGSPDRRRRRAALSHAVVLALVVASAVLVSVGHDLLPELVRAGDYTFMLRRLGPGIAVLVVASLVLSAVGLVRRDAQMRRDDDGLERWAFVALVAGGADIAVSLLSRERFTVGWYGGRALALVASVIVLLALLNQVTVLYRRRGLATAQLKARNAELLEAQAVRDHLVAVVSHDLRTPLAGLTGYLELMGEHDLPPEQASAMVERGQRLVRRMTLLTEDLLAASTTARGGGVLEVWTRPTALLPALEEAAADFPEAVVRLQCPPELEVLADPLRLQQILVNLIGNAVKYGAEPVDVGVEWGPGPDGPGPDGPGPDGPGPDGPGPHPAGRDVLLVVTDAGPGVPADFVPYLFERYTRADGHHVEGSGLGLSVVRDLARAQGGEARYEQTRQAFVVSLPAAGR